MDSARAFKGSTRKPSPFEIIQSQSEIELDQSLDKAEINLLSRKYSTANLSEDIQKVQLTLNSSFLI